MKLQNRQEVLLISILKTFNLFNVKIHTNRYFKVAVFLYLYPNLYYMKNLFLLVFLASFTLLSQSQTQLDYYLPQNTSYNSNIPTPQSVIGHEVGKWHVTHDKLVQYMYALDAASDRITIENRGTTFEDRPLLLLTITSPKNHQNLESIRKAHIDATNNNNAVNISEMFCHKKKLILFRIIVG